MMEERQTIVNFLHSDGQFMQGWSHMIPHIAPVTKTIMSNYSKSVILKHF